MQWAITSKLAWVKATVVSRRNRRGEISLVIQLTSNGYLTDSLRSRESRSRHQNSTLRDSSIHLPVWWRADTSLPYLRQTVTVLLESPYSGWVNNVRIEVSVCQAKAERFTRRVSHSIGNWSFYSTTYECPPLTEKMIFVSELWLDPPGGG